MEYDDDASVTDALIRAACHAWSHCDGWPVAYDDDASGPGVSAQRLRNACIHMQILYIHTQ